MDSVHLRKLMNRVSTYVGMINEVTVKCLLLKNRVQLAERHEGVSDELELHVRSSLRQMKKDLAKYHRKLNKIYEELQNHGIISNME